jgi:hypothetical protein
MPNAAVGGVGLPRLDAHLGIWFIWIHYEMDEKASWLIGAIKSLMWHQYKKHAN